MKLDKIHEDFRGGIYSVTGNMKTPEISIMSTKSGVARGGCWHDHSAEHLIVVEGRIEYVYGDDKKSIILEEGESISIPPKTPHYMLSLTDSIIMEFGPKVEEKQEKHLEFRSIVNKINEANK